MSQYVFSISLDAPFEVAVDRVTEALKAEGFGVLTVIDVAATLKEKLGIEQRAYKILGACNPQFAHLALKAEPDIGALLPCNVVVREEADGRMSIVFMDPEAVLGMVGNPKVSQVGREVRARLVRVADTLKGQEA